MPDAVPVTPLTQFFLSRLQELYDVRDRGSEVFTVGVRFYPSREDGHLEVDEFDLLGVLIIRVLSKGEVDTDQAKLNAYPACFRVDLKVIHREEGRAILLHPGRVEHDLREAAQGLQRLVMTEAVKALRESFEEDLDAAERNSVGTRARAADSSGG